jgi:hypothetical protein
MTQYTKSGNQLSARSIRIWRTVQFLLFVVGLALIFFLIFLPDLGFQLFWNGLIFLAPALLVVAVGLWRNICPLGSVSLFPRHMGWSKAKKITVAQSGILNLIAVLVLLVAAPVRHVLFDLSGMATGILLLLVGLLAFILGFYYEWKSVWCSGLCPVYPVEKLYAMKNKLVLPNAHCDSCHRCVVPCPDTAAGNNSMSTKKTTSHKIAGFLMAAAFPGFVWGWFQVPAIQGPIALADIWAIYEMPLLGMGISILAFVLLRQVVKENILVSVAAATAVSLYYWFKIPALFGYGLFPGKGYMFDLREVWPEWAFMVIAGAVVLFFFWWLVVRKQNDRSWVVRPEYAEDVDISKEVLA